MTNISKQKLDKQTERQLFTQFTQIFKNANEAKLAELFDALFSETEKVMFIKRVAMVFLFSKGVSLYAIERALNVSENTVRLHKMRFDEGRYDPIVSMTRKKSFASVDFIETLEVLLRLGMPSYGKDRWKWMK